MVDRILKLVLSKVKRDDYQFLMDNWGPVSPQELQDFSGPSLTRISKVDFINNYAHLCRGKIEKEDVWQLELLFVQKYPARKMWSLYNFEKIPGRQPRQTPDRLVKTFRQQLALYYRSDVSIRADEKLYWLRVCIPGDRSERAQQVASPVYIAYVPQSDFFFMTAIKKDHMKCLVQALMMVVRGHHSTEGLLRGHHLHSLVQLVHNRNRAQEGIRPDKEALKRKRLEDEPAPVKDVTDEERLSKRKRRDACLAVYGPDQQPTLEKVEFTLLTPFKPKFVPADTFDPTEAFNVKVDFTGQSVIEGIRKLAEAGLADLPLPTHLREMHNRGQNRFRIKPRNMSRSHNASQNAK